VTTRSFFRAVLLVLVLFSVALISALTAMRFAIHGSEVSVPDFVGKLPAEARRLAEQNGLSLEVERQFYSSTVPEGRIVSQLPGAFTKVRRGWEIRVAESLGPQRVDIPSVVGQSERAAEMNIRRRGLDVSETAVIEVSAYLANQVVSQNPPANASDVSAPKISLLLGQASQPPAFVMPNFANQQINTVRVIVENAGFHVGTITVSQPPAPSFPAAESAPTAPLPSAGIVVSHSPAAGEKITRGATVNFIVR
jgi:beta-lactam-binding protein with PASTA domain